MTFTTKDKRIKGWRCRFVERETHGGWKRCGKLASNVNYMHRVKNQVGMTPFHFCSEHANYCYIAMVWTEFLNEKWAEDPYAKYYIEEMKESVDD